MGLAEQMAAVDALMRRPSDLPAVLAGEAADAAVLGTVDPERLAATHACFAELVVARWWRERFPATLATLEYFQGGAELSASWLIGHEAFLRAEEEDVRGSALCGAVLAGLAAEELEVPGFLADLLAYEYLVSTGLPRRARGEPIDAELEAELLPSAAWGSGGRLTQDVLTVGFTWPVAELAEEPYEAEPDPHTRLFFLDDEDDAVMEALVPDVVADLVELLVAGADDETLASIDEDAPESLAGLAQLSLYE